VLIDSD